MPSKTPAVVRPGYGYRARLRGIEHSRNVLLIDPDDRKSLGLDDGDIISLTSDAGDGIHREVSGLTVVSFNIPQGRVASCYPEMNPLVLLSVTSEAPDG